MTIHRLACVAVSAAGLGGLAALGGCTTFSTVRSADVRPGLSGYVEAAATSAPGEGATWFFVLDCYRCNKPIPAVELGVTYGVERPDGKAYEAGVALNGVHPQFDGYVQLHGGEASAYGVGARLGLPIPSYWSSNELYLRYDRVLAPDRRLLYNPALFLHVGTSPNGENPGHMLALVQAVGLEMAGSRVTFTPAASRVIGGGGHRSYGTESSFFTVFGTVSGSVTFHGERR